MQSLTKLYRPLSAGLMLTLGLLQAWDSGALSSPGHLLLQVVTAVVLPPGAVLLTKRGAVWAVAITVSAVLLWLARWTAPRPLPALILLISFQAAVLYLVYRTLRKKRYFDPRSRVPAEEVQT
jgi:uncharacterized membrane protein YqaE (UPF0057 family)